MLCPGPTFSNLLAVAATEKPGEVHYPIYFKTWYFTLLWLECRWLNVYYWQTNDRWALCSFELGCNCSSTGGGLDHILSCFTTHVLWPVFAHHKQEVRLFYYISYSLTIFLWICLLLGCSKCLASRHFRRWEIARKLSKPNKPKHRTEVTEDQIMIYSIQFNPANAQKIKIAHSCNALSTII